MPRQRPRDDTYWRLVYPKVSKPTLRAMLKDAGYDVKASLPRDGMAALLRRHDAGNVNYYKCSKIDLNTFTVDRRILSKKATPLRAGSLIPKLLEADANATFTRFRELPPELRVRVYEYYIDSITEKPVHIPVDPPLTRVSCLLRTEALPIFYNTCTIQLTIEEGVIWSMDIQRSTHDFIRTCTKEKFANMRKLSIKYVVGNPRGSSNCATVATAMVTMNARSDAYDLAMWTINGPRRPKIGEILKKEVSEVMDEVVSRKDGEKLTGEDLMKLRWSRIASYIYTDKVDW